MSAIVDRKADTKQGRSLRRGFRGRRGFTLTEILAVLAILSLITVSLFTMFHQGTQTWRLSSARTEAYVKARQVLDMMAREIRGAVLVTAARGPMALGANGVLRRADFVGLNGDNAGLGSSSNEDTLQGWRDTSGTKKEQRFSDQIYFVAPVTNSGQQDLCMIGYMIQDVNGDTLDPPSSPRNAGDDALMRCYATDGGTQGGNVWRTLDFSDNKFDADWWGEVASAVKQLDIKYYDYDENGRLTPYNAWDSLPGSEGTTPSYDDNRLPVAVRITVTVGDKNNLLKGIKLSRIVYLENARPSEPVR